MTFCIITHVTHYKEQNSYFAYGPYVREMNIWFKHVDQVVLVAPLSKESITAIDFAYHHKDIHFKEVKGFDVLSLKSVLKTIFKFPYLFFILYQAMKQADHIHLRCPGNMGLIGALVQILFPKKTKTAKYAGNWDPKAKQPWSYRLQKWLLSNTFLTRNMKVLVYGEWPNQTKNVKPFFTATYSAKEIQIAALTLQNELTLRAEARSAANAFDSAQSDKRVVDSQLSLRAESRSTLNYKFIFVGTLSKGKQPLYAMQLVAQLHQKGIKATLDLYGEGVLRIDMQAYINKHDLQEYIVLKGNQSKETLKEAYQNSHFLILPSKSEGWPKAVAEAMFWGCVPVATAVSCVPYMLDYGNRGVLLHEHLEKDTTILLDLLNDSKAYELKSKAAQNWSQHYTIELFEAEIKKLLAE